MIPGADLLLSGGAGGLSLSTSSSARTGPATIGAFSFAPKSSTLPPVAWIALAAIGVVLALAWMRR